MSTTPEFSPAIPIFRSYSEEKAKEFYLDFLGFTLDWEHRFGDNFPLYMQITRGSLRLHLTEHHGDCTPGSVIFVPTEGLDALHAELNAKDYKHAKPGIQKVDWGRELSVADPFGNRIRFCEQRHS
jgi:catechol 2,3-dioxygenase-like lactoylglutathione lyase family enzyme